MAGNREHYQAGALRYHVPRSWLKPFGNVLVLLEEAGDDPTAISFGTRETGHICSKVSENYPIPLDMWTSDHLQSKNIVKPTLSLQCPSPNQVISELQFVSFGNPHGACGSFSHGLCRSKRARRIVHQVCMGKAKCSFEVSVNAFGDPSANFTKSLAVEASCS